MSNRPPPHSTQRTNSSSSARKRGVGAADAAPPGGRAPRGRRIEVEPGQCPRSPGSRTRAADAEPGRRGDRSFGKGSAPQRRSGDRNRARHCIGRRRPARRGPRPIAPDHGAAAALSAGVCRTWRPARQNRTPGRGRRGARKRARARARRWSICGWSLGSFISNATIAPRLAAYSRRCWRRRRNDTMFCPRWPR